MENLELLPVIGVKRYICSIGKIVVSARHTDKGGLMFYKSTYSKPKHGAVRAYESINELVGNNDDACIGYFPGRCMVFVSPTQDGFSVYSKEL